MKQRFLILIASLALGFVACSENTEASKEEKLTVSSGASEYEAECLSGNLEKCFFAGLSFKYKDCLKAREWFEKAAQQGDALAQVEVGETYYDGCPDAERDYAKAKRWFEKAAEQGNATAQHNIGRMYELGKGVEQNLQIATQWFEKSAQSGNVTYQQMLGSFYRDSIDMQDFSQSFKWFEKAAQQDNIYSIGVVGVYYYEGKGVKQDYQKAFEWFKKGAEQNHTKSQYFLGLMYAQGLGVEKDLDKAQNYLQQVQQKLQEKCEKGKEYVDSCEWLVEVQKVINQSDKQDYHQAFKSFKKTEEKMEAKSYYNNGLDYAKGTKYDEKDLKMAQYYFAKAQQKLQQGCNDGYQDSCELLTQVQEDMKKFSRTDN